MAKPRLDLYFNMVQTLESLGIEYVIIGAFAGTSYGISRTTFDVDIVVNLKESQLESLVAAYPPPRYYADPEQMRSSIQWGIMFNIIDTSAGDKVDLIPLTMQPSYDFALAARIRRMVATPNGEEITAWLARPEDVIVGKLMAWREGGSFKHETDIRDILIAIRLGDEPGLSAAFDFSYVDAWAAELGEVAQHFWHNLKAITQADVEAST
jgi:hypothetical protein